MLRFLDLLKDEITWLKPNTLNYKNVTRKLANLIPSKWKWQEQWVQGMGFEFGCTDATFESRLYATLHSKFLQASWKHRLDQLKESHWQFQCTDRTASATPLVWKKYSYPRLERLFECGQSQRTAANFRSGLWWLFQWVRKYLPEIETWKKLSKKLS